MMQASNRDACPWLKHKRTCKKQMPPGSFLARRLDPTPRTTNPISHPDISQSLMPNVSESQSVILSSHDLWENNPKHLPGPSRTNPPPGPRNSATVLFADWPSVAVWIHPTRDKATRFSHLGHGSPSR